MQKGLTELVFILDKSGSMGVIRDAAISGFNETVGASARHKTGTRIPSSIWYLC